MTKISDLHTEWLKDPAYQQAYAALEDEFALAETMIAVRVRAGLTQEELAQRMQTTQSAIARIESGRSLPSARTLQKLAEATGTKLKISFEAMQPKSAFPSPHPAE